MSKSNEYGYIPESPTQAIADNTGIFEVNDIVGLIQAGQWSLQGDLILIETKNITSGVTEADFLDIKEDIYDVHFMTINNLQYAGTHNFGFRFYESGVLESAGVYKQTQHYVYSGGGSGDERNNGTGTYIPISSNINASGLNAYVNFYKLGDSSNRSFVSFQTAQGYSTSNEVITRIGGGVLPQTSTVDGIRIFTGANFTCTASLYGYKVS